MERTIEQEKERKRKIHRKWHRRNRVSERLRRKANYLKEKAKREDLKQKIALENIGNCTCCGEDNIKFLRLHPTEPNPILCYNCYWANRVYGICPHEVVKKEGVYYGMPEM